MKKSMYFLIIMIIFYIILYISSVDIALSALDYVTNIFFELIPILGLVYVFMFAFSFVKEKRLKKFIQKAPMFLQFLLMALLGTISHGPIYAWFPLLEDLQNKGISKGHIATFLYSRGIKLTLLPMLVVYFDLKYVIVLSVVLFVFSIIKGYIFNILYSVRKPILNKGEILKEA